METILITSTILIAIVYSFIEKGLSRCLIRIKEIYKSPTMWVHGTNEQRKDLNNLHDSWHSRIAWLKIFFALAVGLWWFFAFDGIEVSKGLTGFDLLLNKLLWQIILSVILVLNINWIMDSVLYAIKGWPLTTLGDRSGMDRIGFVWRWILLVFVLITLILICSL